MKYFLLLILVFATFAVRADEPRFSKIFISANDKFELKLNLEERDWSLIEKSSGKELYKLTGSLWSMTVLISDDGKSVIAIDDYSEQDPEDNSEVLIFYNNGNRIKAHKLNEVFDDLKFISQSVSHFRWLFKSQKGFSINDSKISLTTFEMNNLVFDIETGNLLKKEKDKSLSGDAIYVYGKVKGLDGEKHEIQVECVINGKAKKGEKILFNSKEFRWEGSNSNESLIINDARLVSRKGVIFNRCI